MRQAQEQAQHKPLYFILQGTSACRCETRHTDRVKTAIEFWASTNRVPISDIDLYSARNGCCFVVYYNGGGDKSILDQHDRYDLPQLSKYVGNYYPDMPQSLREPVILATVTAARRASLFYNNDEKNVGSRDNSKREFAAEAASALSFWALGLRPAHRFTEAQSDRSGFSAAAPEVTQPLDMTSSFLPVPMVDGNLDF